MNEYIVFPNLSKISHFLFQSIYLSCYIQLRFWNIIKLWKSVHYLTEKLKQTEFANAICQFIFVSSQNKLKMEMDNIKQIREELVMDNLQKINLVYLSSFFL